MSITETTDFENARKRLDEIVGEVRSKDLSLEKSLDLYEEAIKLGTTCSQLVDKAAFSADEHAALNGVIAEQNADMEEAPAEASGQPEVEEEAAPDADGTDGQDEPVSE